MDQTQRCIHKGMLLKRCTLSWRPRYVEMVLNPGSLATGNNYSHQLVLYDQHRHIIKNRISFDDVVTVRSCRDCIFQVFISDGKILQFRSDSVESQAHWMAALKVGLGKGHIFHVRVHMSSGLEHALLYSIGVNLPAHRVGQLDRVLVLASPINDINLNAWDLNRIKAFQESDVGIRMEICPSCIRGGQPDRITFIMEKKFINDCTQFLLREARMRDIPQIENGLKTYNVPHQCGYIKQPDMPAPPLPPPYTEDETPPPKLSQPPQPSQPSQDKKFESGPSVTRKKSSEFHSISMGKIRPAYPVEYWNDSTGSGSGSFTGLSRTESIFLADGSLSVKTNKKVTNDFHALLPPRTIPRANHESSIPAKAHPYLKYQPHFYHQHQGRHYEPPYQISSRIIITDSGEVQFERNIMGNVSSGQKQGGLPFKKQLPVPPRGLRAPSPQQPSPKSSPILSQRLKISTESKVRVESKASPESFQKPYISKQRSFSAREGGQLSREDVKEAAPAPPPIPEHPPYNIREERFISTAPGGRLVHHPSFSGLPPSADTSSARPKTEAAPVTTQKSRSSHLLAMPPKRLSQSISDSSLAAKATNCSITTFFKPNETVPTPTHFSQNRTIKRTSSDSGLPVFTAKGGSQHGNQTPAPGNRTVASIKSSSLKRASQVSDSSDIYIIPTPPWSVSSYPSRGSDSNNPISPSYVRETEFLGQGLHPTKPLDPFSELPDEDDSAFLPDEGDSEEEDGYENGEFLRRMSQKSHGSQSSTDYYDDIMSVRQKLVINSTQSGDLSVTADNTTSAYHNLTDVRISNSSTTEVSIEGTRGEQAVKNTPTSSDRSPHPRPLPRHRKPVPQPRRSTLSSSSSGVSDGVWLSQTETSRTRESSGEQRNVNRVTKGGDKEAAECNGGTSERGQERTGSNQISRSASHNPHSVLSPKRNRVTFEEAENFVFTHHLHAPVSAGVKSLSLPRKAPVPKPRTKTYEEAGMAGTSHLSTSEGHLGEATAQSMELKDSRYKSKSTHMVLFNGREVGVTDL